jgi:hypothetical protein
MEDFKGKSYVRLNSPNTDALTVKETEGDFVYFTNGAKCKISTLENEFVEAGSINENVGSVSDSFTIDPDAFFNTPANPDLVFNNDPSKIENSFEVGNTPKEQNANTLESRLNEDNGIKNYSGPQYPALNPYNNVDEPAINVSQSQQHTPAPKHVEKRLPEWDVFDRLKTSEEITINIPFTIRLPKAQKIDAMNDMFESSLIEYLAKQFVENNVVKDSKMVQNKLSDAIEEWVEEELYGKKKKRPAKKKEVMPASTIADDIVPVQPMQQPDPKVLVDSVSDAKAEDQPMFQPYKPNWDGNVYKLSVINVLEQYDAVAAEVKKLKDNNGNQKVIDRFEDLMSVYEEQMESVKKNG